MELGELAWIIHGAASLGAWLCLADMEDLHPQVASHHEHTTKLQRCLVLTQCDYAAATLREITWINAM